MKIMHVLKKYPRALGGDAVVVANLQKQQEAAGHQTAIVTSNCDEIISGKHIYKCGLKDTPTGLDKITPKRLVSLVSIFFYMFAILRKERPDIIHTHSIDMAFFISFAARWYGIPIVHTFHIVTFYDNNQSIVRQKSELWLAKHARFQSITAPNNFDVKKLRAAGFTQTVLLPNGVDIDFWQPGTRIEKNQDFMFLTVGRLEKQKGYDYLIKAVFYLARNGLRPFKVIVVGEGSQKEALQNLAHSLGVAHLVHFVGKKNPAEIRELLAIADASVFPSLYETTPVTMLEAWAAGVPVIASSVGILRDYPVDFGAAYIVPPKDEQALMQSMRTCVNSDDLRNAIAAKGNTEVKKYTWPTIAKAAEAVYGSVQ